MDVTRAWGRIAARAPRPAPRTAGLGGWFSAGVLAIGCASVAALSAQRVFTVDDLDSAMKAVGRNVDLAKGAIAAKDFDTAKLRIARGREQLSLTYSFWLLEKRPDGMKMVRNATATLDNLDAVLSTSPVDPAAAAAVVAKVDAACQACHAIYREEDTATRTFKLKPQPKAP